MIQSILGLGAFAALSAIVTFRFFSAEQLSLLTKLSICGLLWGTLIWFAAVLRRYYRRIPVEPSKVVEAVAVLEVAAATVQATGDTRVNLSVPHLLSAAVLSRRVGELEAEHSGKEFGEFWQDIFANASGAVFASVAALESYANELFIDHEKVFPELRVEVMAKLWELYEQKPTLEKFEFALLLKAGPSFDRGASPYQDVAAIIRLRNALIHFKPEWFSEQDEHAKLSTQLKHRATPSPFFPMTEPLFPRGWTSHATIEWVVRSVLSFILEFERRANVEPRMAPFQDRFNAL